VSVGGASQRTQVDDLGAAVAWRDDAQSQPAFDQAGCVRGAFERLGAPLRLDDGEARRAPRTLADRGPVRTCRDPVHQSADRGTGVGTPILDRREILAEEFLNARDADRENVEFSAGSARQHAHQHLVANRGGVRGRHGAERGQRTLLVAAGQATLASILHDDDAPFLGQRHA
jgi:hypothetical protein